MGCVCCDGIRPRISTIRGYGDSLLVSYLTGFPFAVGNASLQLVDRHRGVATPLITGLQTAIDVLPITRGTGLFYVLEQSQQLKAGAPGCLLRIDAWIARHSCSPTRSMRRRASRSTP
jgi:hypothetical protein